MLAEYAAGQDDIGMARADSRDPQLGATLTMKRHIPANRHSFISGPLMQQDWLFKLLETTVKQRIGALNNFLVLHQAQLVPIQSEVQTLVL